MSKKLIAILLISLISTANAQDTDLGRLNFVFDARPNAVKEKKPVHWSQHVFGEPAAGAVAGGVSVILGSRVIGGSRVFSGHSGGLAGALFTAIGAVSGTAGSLTHGLWLRDKVGAWGIPLSAGGAALTTSAILMAATKGGMDKPMMLIFSGVAALGAAAGAASVEGIRALKKQ